MPSPELGEIVHYRLSAEFGKNTGRCRPMVITAISDNQDVSGQCFTDPEDFTIGPVVPRLLVPYVPADDTGQGYHYRAECAGP